MKHLDTLRVPFEVKSADSRAMTFEGLLSAWTVDTGNDRVVKGAFARTLDHWKAAGGKRVIPLIDQHQYDSINRVVGKMVDAEEQDAGLYTKWEMIPDDDESAKAYRRIKGGYVGEMSMGYQAVGQTETEEAKTEDGQRRKVRVLREVKLHEGSLVIWAMQPDARIDPESVKSLLACARLGTLTDEQKQELRALLDAPLAGTPAGDSPAPDAKGLAPDDPRRLATEALARDVILRGLAA